MSGGAVVGGSFSGAGQEDVALDGTWWAPCPAHVTASSGWEGEAYTARWAHPGCLVGPVMCQHSGLHGVMLQLFPKNCSGTDLCFLKGIVTDGLVSVWGQSPCSQEVHGGCEPGHP